MGRSVNFNETPQMLITVKIVFEVYFLVIHVNPFGCILASPCALSYSLLLHL